MLEVGRSSRSTITHSDNSIVITNNSQAPSANTRSRTRQAPSANTRSRTRSDTRSGALAADPPQITDARTTRTRTPRSVPRGTPSTRRTTQSAEVLTVTEPRSSAQPSSSARSSSRDVIEITDNQPSTSSGRRAAPRHRNRNSRRSVSHRLIINGVPIHGWNDVDGGHLLEHFASISNLMPTSGMFWQGGDVSMSYEVGLETWIGALNTTFAIFFLPKNNYR